MRSEEALQIRPKLVICWLAFLMILGFNELEANYSLPTKLTSASVACSKDTNAILTRNRSTYVSEELDCPLLPQDERSLPFLSSTMSLHSVDVTNLIRGMTGLRSCTISCVHSSGQIKPTLLRVQKLVAPELRCPLWLRLSIILC